MGRSMSEIGFDFGRPFGLPDTPLGQGGRSPEGLGLVLELVLPPDSFP